MTFEDLDLIDDLLDALEEEGYEEPTPIQQQAIPPLLKGRDVLGVAQTGTGKTAAFALPILQQIADKPLDQGKRKICTLVVTPTRELAAQIGESFEKYGKYLDIRHTVIFGGVKQGKQVTILQRGVDILVATPGRLLDLINQGYIDLSFVEFFALDEADRMLDMGFINDIKKLLKLLPKERQNLLFSATMPASIATLAGTFLDKPISVSVTPEETTVEAIAQKVMFCSKTDKRRLLPWLIDELEVERAIVFTRTKHGANRLVKELLKKDIPSAAIHGNKSQGARIRALQSFKDNEIKILVATDIASRGLDIPALNHVFNFDLPNEEESYVHRIGRTGRAGRDGIAISFCEVEEGGYLRDIERLIGFSIEVDEDHPFHDASAIPDANATSQKGKRNRTRGPASKQGNRHGRGGGGGHGGGSRGGRGNSSGGRGGRGGKGGGGRGGSRGGR